MSSQSVVSAELPEAKHPWWPKIPILCRFWVHPLPGKGSEITLAMPDWSPVLLSKPTGASWLSLEKKLFLNNCLHLQLRELCPCNNFSIKGWIYLEKGTLHLTTSRSSPFLYFSLALMSNMGTTVHVED